MLMVNQRKFLLIIGIAESITCLNCREWRKLVPGICICAIDANVVHHFVLARTTCCIQSAAPELSSEVKVEKSFDTVVSRAFSFLLRATFVGREWELVVEPQKIHRCWLDDGFSRPTAWARRRTGAYCGCMRMHGIDAPTRRNASRQP